MLREDEVPGCAGSDNQIQSCNAQECPSKSLKPQRNESNFLYNDYS